MRKSHQIIYLVSSTIFTTIIGTYVGNLVSELPGIPDFPFKDQILITSVFLLLIISFFITYKLTEANDEDITTTAHEKTKSRKALLERLQKTWISNILERSLYQYARQELSMNISSDTTHPWEIQVEEHNLPKAHISSLQTPVIDKFDSLGEGGTMLILGEPGSGKTTTLLELSKELLIRAKHNEESDIPVVLHLASWNRSYKVTSKNDPLNQPLEDWIISELQGSLIIQNLIQGKNLGYRIPSHVVRLWLKEQRLILLLDGLDEVVPERRSKCVEAINQFKEEFSLTEIVVCCRNKDYRELLVKLEFQLALLIQPLELEKIENYFNKAGIDASEVKILLPDKELRDLLSSPLSLLVFTLAYREIPKDKLRSASSDERLKILLDTYIYKQINSFNYVTSRNESIGLYPTKITLFWLKLVSKVVTAHSGFVFSTENISISWLNILNGRKSSYKNVFSKAITNLMLKVSSIPYGFPVYIAYLSFGMSILAGMLWFMFTAAYNYDLLQTLKYNIFFGKIFIVSFFLIFPLSSISIWAYNEIGDRFKPFQHKTSLIGIFKIFQGAVFFHL